MKQARKKYFYYQSWKFPEDFHYVVDVDYERTRASNHATRCENDYCRCSTLEHARVVDVNVDSVREAILKGGTRVKVLPDITGAIPKPAM